MRQMAKPISTRFAVRSEDEAAAIAHLLDRGYSPVRVEKDDSDLSILVFAPLADDLMLGLV
jgi:hypothetical protein